MPYTFIASFDGKNSDWIPMDGVMRDSKGIITAFGIQMPNWSRTPGYHSVHLVHHEYPFSDVAESIWNATLNIGGGQQLAKKLLEGLEKKAREVGWYDAARYPNMKEHIGKAGWLLASAPLIHKFLKNQPFDKSGYYNPSGIRVITGDPIDAANRERYRP